MTKQALGAELMDVDSSAAPRLPLAERVHSQQSCETPVSRMPACLPSNDLRITADAQRIVTGSSRELSPAAALSQRQARSSSLRIPRGSASLGLTSRSSFRASFAAVLLESFPGLDLLCRQCR